MTYFDDSYYSKLIKTSFRGSVIIASMFLTACSTDGNSITNLGKDNLSWFTSSKSVDGTSVSLSRDHKILANGNETEIAVHNAIELARQKRFMEARYLLAEVRDLQAPKDDGYQAVTCAMAILSLREGDIVTFKRTARQLDMALNEPVNVAPSYVEIISLYRILSGKNLPVNAPKGMKRLKEEYGSFKIASL